MVELSVIIVNYNVKVFLEQALHSILKALEGITSEIFVVDNASWDGSVPLVQKKFPMVHLVRNHENVGFAKANNQALKKAKGQVVCLINPDTMVREDTFHTCLEYLANHSDVSAVGCKILNPDGTLQLACRRSFPTPWVAFTKVVGLSNLFPKNRLFGKYNLTYLDPNEIAEVEAISGSFMMVRKKTINRIGYLDEAFFLYGEDLDWCYRIRQEGGKIVYIPQTQIIHYKGQSAKEATFNNLRIFYTAMSLFVNKHFKRGWYILPKWFLIFGIWLRGGLSLLSRILLRLTVPMVDVLFLQAGLLLALVIRFGHLQHLGSYGIVDLVYTLVWIVCMFVFGIYDRSVYNSSKVLGGVLMGLVLNTSFTFFFPQYAYSRKVALMAGFFDACFLVGWRLMIRLISRIGRIPFFGAIGRTLGRRRTLIVGTDNTGIQLLKRLRGRIDAGYEVVGFLGLNEEDLIKNMDLQVPVLGTINDIDHIVKVHKVDEVIFSPGAASYDRILTVVVRGKDLPVDFKMVPRDLDVVIGRTSIDTLDNIPLVDLDYRIFSAPNLIFKRIIDFAFALLMTMIHSPIWLMFILHPLIRFQKKVILDGKGSPLSILHILYRGKALSGWLSHLPLFLHVLFGQLSLVGTEMISYQKKIKGKGFKPGLTGLVQVNSYKDLSDEEKERYNLYYLKGYSPLLDIEILFKAIFHL